MKDVVSVEVREGYRLHLTFEDGAAGVVDVSELVPFTGVFAPLQNRELFAQVEVNEEIGTICWPNGADLDPDVLYALVADEPIPDFEGLAAGSE